MADETDRRLYLVEHDLRGLSLSQPACVHGAPGEAVRREARRAATSAMSSASTRRKEGRCLCLFEAAGPEVVRNVNDIAQFSLARVIAVLSTVPDGSSPLADLAQDSLCQHVLTTSRP